MIDWSELEVILNKLKVSVKSRDYIAARKLLTQAVPGFTPKKIINDPMFLDK